MKAALKKNMYVILLGVLILVQLGYFVYCFETKKVSYHSDEIWSYGIANNATGPNVFKDNTGEYFINCNQWLSGDVFGDYIMVDEDERFNYSQVWENASYDYHPPLSFVILNTICSLFPNTYSQWYGFIINLVAFVIIQIALFMWGKTMMKSDWKALVLCIFYGFSLAALNTMMFVRMYGLATAFTLISITCHYNIFIDKKCNFKRNLIGIFVATLLGALTIHLYLVLAFFISAMFCIWLLFSKQIKKLVAYVGTMLASVGASILMFPATINHMFSVAGNELRQDKAPLFFDVKLGIGYITDVLFGFTIDPYPSYFSIYLIEVLLILVIVLVPLAFVCRKEKWMPGLVLKIKGFFKRVPLVLKKVNWFVVMIFVAIFLYIVVVAESIEIVQTGQNVDRYFMNVYPLVYGAFVYILFLMADKMKLLIKVKYNTEIVNCIVAITLIVVVTIVNQTGCYYYHNWTEHYKEKYNKDITAEDEVLLSEIDDDSDLIITLKEFWLMTCLSYEFKDCDNFFATFLNQILVGESFDKNFVAALEDVEVGESVYWVTELPFHSGALNGSMGVEQYSETVLETKAVVEPDDPLIKDEMEVLKKNMAKIKFVDEVTYVGRSYIYGRVVFVYKLK